MYVHASVSVCVCVHVCVRVCVSVCVRVFGDSKDVYLGMCVCAC